MARHPHIGRPWLEWIEHGQGYTAKVCRRAKYRTDTSYRTEEDFAYVRRANKSSNLIWDGPDVNWFVFQHAFDDARDFHSLGDAKLYVESLFALQYID